MLPYSGNVSNYDEWLKARARSTKDTKTIKEVTGIKDTLYNQLSPEEQAELYELSETLAYEQSQLLLQKYKMMIENKAESMFLDLTTTEDVTIPWLFTNFIAQGDLTILAGNGNVGKTFVLLDLALSAITQSVFANQFSCTKACNVLILLGEGAQSIKYRLKGVLAKYGLSSVPQSLLVSSVMPNFNTGSGIVNLQLELKKLQFEPDLIMIDTLSTALNGMDENSSGSVSKCLAMMKLLAKPYNASVIVSHHTTKGNDLMYRGSSAIRNNADNLYLISQRDDTAILQSNKQRDSKPCLDIAFTIAGDPPAIQWNQPSKRNDGKVGQTDREKVLDLLQYDPCSFDEIFSHLGKDNTKAQRQNVKRQVLQPLIDEEVITEAEGSYSLVG